MMSHKSGNISIFVIFVLLASSLLGLLTLILVQKLLRYQGVAIGYYQSYYSAKAGMETALALHNTRGVGFSYTVPGSLFSENLSCGSACTVQAELIGRSTFIQDDYWLHTQCTSGFVIEPGQSKAIPLFYDDGEAGVYQLFTDPVEYTSIYSSFTNINAAPVTRESGITIRMGMFALSGNALITDGSFIQDYNGSIMQMIPWFWNVYQAYAIGYPALQSPTVQHYLLLANPTQSPIQLCVSTQGLYDPIQLGQEIAWLRSVASYTSYRVGLQAVLDSSIPQFLLQTYSEL